MHCVVIANPAARQGRSEARLRHCLLGLDAGRLSHDLLWCRDLADAERLSRRANLAGAETIVAAGGDGTINRVLNGFFDRHGRRISRARLGVLYCGTSPDFCRSHQIPTTPTAAIDTLARGRARAVSVGRITFRQRVGPALTERISMFACCANIGVGAPLARLVNRGIRRYVGDRLGTFISLIRVLVSYRPRTYQVALDGQQHVSAKVMNLSVGKTFYVASGLKIRHDLSEVDPRFYVVTLSNLSPGGVLRMLRTLYTGAPIGSTGSLSMEYARQIVVSAERTEVEYDGDPAGDCPCRIENAPDPLDLITSTSRVSPTAEWPAVPVASCNSAFQQLKSRTPHEPDRDSAKESVSDSQNTVVHS